MLRFQGTIDELRKRQPNVTENVKCGYQFKCSWWSIPSFCTKSDFNRQVKRTFHVSYLKNTFCALASCALCTDEHIIQYIYTSNAKISQIDDQPDQGQQSHDYFQAFIYGHTYEVRSTINTSDSVLEHSFSFSAPF